MKQIQRGGSGRWIEVQAPHRPQPDRTIERVAERRYRRDGSLHSERLAERVTERYPQQYLPVTPTRAGPIERWLRAIWETILALIGFAILAVLLVLGAALGGIVGVGIAIAVFALLAVIGGYGE